MMIMTTTYMDTGRDKERERERKRESDWTPGPGGAAVEPPDPLLALSGGLLFDISPDSF